MKRVKKMSRYRELGWIYPSSDVVNNNVCVLVNNDYADKNVLVLNYYLNSGIGTELNLKSMNLYPVDSNCNIYISMPNKLSNITAKYYIYVKNTKTLFKEYVSYNGRNKIMMNNIINYCLEFEKSLCNTISGRLYRR